MLKKFKKTISFLLEVILSVLMLAVSLPMAISANGYDAGAAIEYAHKWTNASGGTDTSSYNPAYTSHPGHDCINYVSQCLRAGGIATDGTWYPESSAWLSCTSFFRWANSCGYKYIDAPSVSDLDIGDVILYADSSSKRSNRAYYHASIVCEKNGSTAKVCAHSNNRKCSSGWNYDYPTVIKMGSSTPTPTSTWDFNKPTTYPSYPGILKSGSTGTEVSFVQTALNWLGYNCGSVDGQFGSNTTAQVKAFQSAVGLDADGIVGSYTWNALISRVGVDIGTGFWAYIIQKTDWKHIENTGKQNDDSANGNIQIALNGNDSYDPKQIWYFERTSEGRYKIKNAFDDQMLDLSNAVTSNGNNIITHVANGNSAQEWIIYYNIDGGSYGFRTACGSTVLDCNGASTEPGTNIQIWDYNQTYAQKFAIYLLADDGLNYSKPSAPSTPTFSVTATGSDVSFSWTSSPLKDSKFDNRIYRLRIWKGTSVDANGTEIIKKDYTGLKSNLTLEDGTYTAVVTASNTKYYNYGARSSSVTFTVTSCSHDWQWITDNEATCEENGIKHEKCSLCGETRSEKTEIPATGHSWNSGEITKEATCFEVGVKTYTCSSCQKTKTQSIDILQHDYSGKAVSLNNGTHYYLCLNGCGNYGVGDVEGETESCSFSEWSIDYSTVVAGNPCLSSYTEFRLCSDCGYKDTKHISEYNHEYGEATIENLVEADCENDGSYDEVYYCTKNRCGKELSRKTVIIPATGHTEETLVAVEPTCAVTGLTEGLRCSTCGKIFKEQTVIPATGHVFVDTDLKCLVCGYVRSCEHSYGEWKINKQPTCTASGTQERVCTICSYRDIEVVAPLGHSPIEKVDSEFLKSEATCTKAAVYYKSCGLCHLKLTSTFTSGSPLNHDYEEEITEPTCTSSGYITYNCKLCGDSYVCIDDLAIGHKYSNKTDSKYLKSAATCTASAVYYKSCSVCLAKGTSTFISGTPLGHYYDEDVTEPTCTTSGYTTFTCTRCDDTYIGDEVPAAGHKYINKTDSKYLKSAATCTASAVYYKSCSVCLAKGTSTFISGTPLGHDYDEDVTEPTCTTSGYTTFTCTRCDDSYIDNSVSATAHKYINKTDSKYLKSAASCTSPAVYYKSCSVCGAKTPTTFTVGSKLEHNFDEDIESNVTIISATCTENGSKTVKCSRCDEIEVTTIEKIGHTPESAVKENIINSTCSSKGSYNEVVYCLVCKNKLSTKKIETEKLSHTDQIISETKPTCTMPGLTSGKKCSVCGEVLVKQETVNALGHTKSEWITDKDSDCINGGTKYIECTVCGEVLETESISVKNHTFIETVTAPTCISEGFTIYTCTVCGTGYTGSIIDPIGHNEVTDKAVAATCTTAGKTAGTHCSVCGTVIKTQTIVKATGHSYSSWKTTKAASCTETGIQTRTCSLCGSKETKIINVTGHKAVIDKAVAATCTTSGKTAGSHCSVCGEFIVVQKNINATGHQYSAEVTAPTCTESGYTTHTCSVCGDTYTDTTVKATGHSFGSWVTTKAATYTATGTQTRTCSKCDKTETKTIAKLKTTDVSKCTSTVTATVIYTDNAIKPTVTVKNGKTTLKAGTHYNVTYKNNTKIGTATVTITGIAKNGYSGTKTLTFKIVPAKVTGLKAAQTTSSVTLAWTNVSGAASYNVYSYNAKTKKYTKVATVKTNKATIKDLKAGTAYSYAVEAVANSQVGEKSAVLGTATVPAAPTVKVTAGSKQAKLSWNKVTGATDYVIYYSTSKNGTYKKIASTTSTSYTAKKLTTGKTYYFKVVAYKTVGKTTINSAYSAVKSVKVK